VKAAAVTAAGILVRIKILPGGDAGKNPGIAAGAVSVPITP